MYLDLLSLHLPRLTRLFSLIGCLAFAGSFAPVAKALPITIDSPTTSWTIFTLASGNPMDFLGDQQTGQSESDIIGNSGHPGVYYHFDNNGVASHTDGNLYFRVRTGRDQNPAGFQNVLFVGILADAGDSIDLFIGYDGGAGQIKIWWAGNGTNVSPNTTTINSPTNQVFFPVNSSNYHWAPVNSTIQPGLTSTDINADGFTDYFLSFMIPFQSVVNELARAVSINITDQTALRFVIATATQQNSLNQDLGGVQGGVNSAQTWTQLGATSPPISLGGPPPPIGDVPEPGTWAMLGAGLAFLAIHRHRRARG